MPGELRKTTPWLSDELPGDRFEVGAHARTRKRYAGARRVLWVRAGAVDVTENLGLGNPEPGCAVLCEILRGLVQPGHQEVGRSGAVLRRIGGVGNAVGKGLWVAKGVSDRPRVVPEERKKWP